jgi:tRNA(fMet)-specific endonuclease VapC
MLYMLDTDTVSYILKGRHPRIAAKLAEISPDNVCLSVMTRAELLYGLKALPANHRLHIAVRQFFQMVHVLPWPIEAAQWYADMRHQLKSAGTPIGDMDLMIAAHSLAATAILVTNNTRHFERIDAPLMLANWA